ncbi:MAG: peptidylprolyl isomerase [Melioribacteraceae bacterium]
MMAQMRSMASWFIIGVGVLFIAFMVLSDSKCSESASRGNNNVGEINGKAVTYQEFSSLVEQYRKNQVQQSGQEVPETQMDAFRDRVWDDLVSQNLMQEKIKEFGITITDQEIIDVIQGPNPPQIITQNFMDSTGQFNRQAYDQAILDPENKQAMLQVEESVRQQMIQQKLVSYLGASIVVSDEEVKKNYVDQNVKMTADYALIDAVTMPDENIKFEDSDLTSYFNNNKDDYKIDAQRKIKYILFKKVPSQGDSTAIKKNLDAIVKKLKVDTSTFKTYVDIYSDKPYSLDTLGLSLLPENFSSPIANANIGDIIGPAISNQGYAIYRLTNSFKSKDAMVRASHILIKNGTNADSAKMKIDELYNQLSSGTNFEQLAIAQSEDGSAAKGGDLGWFGKGQMVKPFEDASYRGKIGVIQKPIKSRFGYHIIKVTGKSNRKYVVEKIVNTIIPSAITIDRLNEDAQDFAYLAEKNNFEEEAKLLEYNVQETPLFTEESKSIPGLGTSSALSHFAFESSLSKVSSVFKVSAGYAVAMVSDILKAGHKPFEDVKTAIEKKVIHNKKMEIAKTNAAEILAKVSVSGDLNLAKEVYPSVRISKATNFGSSGNIPGIGREFAFAQAALDAEINKVTNPIKTNRGYYLLKVINRTAIDSTMFSIQKKALRNNLLSQKKNRVLSEWVKGLKEEADVVDNRHSFFR